MKDDPHWLVRIKRALEHLEPTGQQFCKHTYANDVRACVAALEAAWSKSGQAYQVIGALADATEMEKLSEAGIKRALDYFSDAEAYDECFLPWSVHEEA